MTESDSTTVENSMGEARLVFSLQRRAAMTGYLSGIRFRVSRSADTAAAAFTWNSPLEILLLRSSRSCTDRASNVGASDSSKAVMPLTCAAAMEEPEVKSYPPPG